MSPLKSSPYFFHLGDAEERVDYSLIRKIPVPNPKKPQESSNHGKHGSGTDTSDLAQENKTLRAQIKQMIALSEEDDAETEKLVQSMNASLNEARQMNRNKDTEMERMQKALAEARRASKAQVFESSSNSFFLFFPKSNFKSPHLHIFDVRHCLKSRRRRASIISKLTSCRPR